MRFQTNAAIHQESLLDSIQRRVSIGGHIHSDVDESHGQLQHVGGASRAADDDDGCPTRQMIARKTETEDAAFNQYAYERNADVVSDQPIVVRVARRWRTPIYLVLGWKNGEKTFLIRVVHSSTRRDGEKGIMENKQNKEEEETKEEAQETKKRQ